MDICVCASLWHTSWAGTCGGQKGVLDPSGAGIVRGCGSPGRA